MNTPGSLDDDEAPGREDLAALAEAAQALPLDATELMLESEIQNLNTDVLQLGPSCDRSRQAFGQAVARCEEQLIRLEREDFLAPPSALPSACGVAGQEALDHVAHMERIALSFLDEVSQHVHTLVSLSDPWSDMLGSLQEVVLSLAAQDRAVRLREATGHAVAQRDRLAELAVAFGQELARWREQALAQIALSHQEVEEAQRALQAALMSLPQAEGQGWRIQVEGALSLTATLREGTNREMGLVKSLLESQASELQASAFALFETMRAYLAAVRRVVALVQEVG